MACFCSHPASAAEPDPPDTVVKGPPAKSVAAWLRKSFLMITRKDHLHFRMAEDPKLEQRLAARRAQEEKVQEEAFLEEQKLRAEARAAGQPAPPPPDILTYHAKGALLDRASPGGMRRVRHSWNGERRSGKVVPTGHGSPQQPPGTLVTAAWTPDRPSEQGMMRGVMHSSPGCGDSPAERWSQRRVTTSNLGAISGLQSDTQRHTLPGHVEVKGLGLYPKPLRDLAEQLQQPQLAGSSPQPATQRVTDSGSARPSNVQLAVPAGIIQEAAGAGAPDSNSPAAQAVSQGASHSSEAQGFSSNTAVTAGVSASTASDSQDTPTKHSSSGARLPPLHPGTYASRLKHHLATQNSAVATTPQAEGKGNQTTEV